MSPSCQVCSSSGECLREASLLLAQLPDTPLVRRERLSFSVTCTGLALHLGNASEGRVAVTVVESLRGLKRASLTGKQEAFLTQLPVKVAKQVRQLTERGWFNFARVELQAGRNPGERGWRKVLCALLIGGDCTRKSIELAFVEQLGLEFKSARVQTSVALSIFAAGRIATEQLGKVVLMPNQSPDN